MCDGGHNAYYWNEEYRCTWHSIDDAGEKSLQEAIQLLPNRDNQLAIADMY